MLELFIESVLSLLEGPLTGIGISPVAVLRGVELFIIVLLTVFGSYFVRRFVRTLKIWVCQACLGIPFIDLI